MKEHTFLPGYDGAKAAQEALREGAANLIWENPESDLFVDWYLRQSSKLPEEQSPEFKIFLDLVETGLASLPTDEQIARYKVRTIREKSEGEA